MVRMFPSLLSGCHSAFFGYFKNNTKGLQVYTVTLTALNRMLRDYSYNGWGYSTLPAGIGHIQEPCRIVLSIYQGEIKTCYIAGKDGQVLMTGKEAQDLIEQVPPLSWSLKSYQDPETPAPSHPAIKSSSPDRTTRPIPALHLPAPSQARPQVSAMEPRMTRPLPAIRPPQETQIYPLRAREIPFTELSRWPRKWRQIYMLANGDMTIDKIATMLTLSPQDMRGILQTMIAQGVIILRQSS